MNVRAITVCVNYSDLLAATLPSILRHVRDLLIVTTPDDLQTIDLAIRASVRLLKTAAFYQNGDTFNKGRALEEGFDVLGRNGWILVLDADVMLPRRLKLGQLEVGCLYSPYRRMLVQPGAPIPPQSDWRHLLIGPEDRTGEYAGYFQLFHASDPVLADKPWYPSHWPTAGGCDSDFWMKWPKAKRRRPRFEVLHLGEAFTNWRGRGAGV
jgi:hypothetical protein